MKSIQLLAPLMLFAACGGNPIEEQQRTWLGEEHAVEQRLVAVRAAHIQSRQALARATDSRGATDPTVLQARVTIENHDSSLTRIEAMFDRQTQLRADAIDSDDPRRMTRALDSARHDYAAARQQLDTLAASIRAVRAQLAASR